MNKLVTNGGLKPSNFDCLKVGNDISLLLSSGFTGYISGQNYFISEGYSQFALFEIDGKRKLVSLNTRHYPHHNGIADVIASFNSGKNIKILQMGNLHFDKASKNITFDGLFVCSQFRKIQLSYDFLNNIFGYEYSIYKQNNFAK